MINSVKILQIRQDLRSGEGLEETLIKHGTNLCDAFNSARKGTRREVNLEANRMAYIYPTRSNTWRVQKSFGTGSKFCVCCGAYKTLEDAVFIRDCMVDCDWDKNRLVEFKKRRGLL